MKTVLNLVISAALLCCTANAQATTTITNEWVPVDGAIALNYCNGELVAFYGELHVVTHTTITPTGQVNFNIQSNPNSLIGVGLTTGDTYIGLGHISVNSHFTPGSFPEIATIRNDFRAVLVGSGAEFEVTMFSHVAVNANGDVATVVSFESIGCL